MGTSRRGGDDEKMSARRRVTDRRPAPRCQFTGPSRRRDACSRPVDVQDDRRLFAPPEKPMAALSPLAPERFPELPPIAGVRLAVYAAGIRYAGRNDMMLAELAPGS